MEWRGWDHAYLLPRASILWSVQGPAPLRVEDGYAWVHWMRVAPAHGRPPRLRLELTTAPDGRMNGSYAPFAGVYQREAEYSLSASWSDLLAFARGAEHLSLVLRDPRGRIVESAPVDPRVFVRGATEIDAALLQIQEISSDYRNRCRPTEDVEPDIVVT